MSISNKNPFEKYKVLLKEIDKHTASLEDVHHKFMNCKNGCDLCCIDFSIFPVEYYYILNELKKENQNLNLDRKSKGDSCAFLKNYSCTIYNHRPIMCRTHGLPLLYSNDDGEFELSVCDLNFTEYDFEDFTIENTMPQDKYNSKLFLLNREFISVYKEKIYNEMDLIPLKELANQI